MNRMDRWMSNVNALTMNDTPASLAMDTVRMIALRPSVIVVSRRDPQTRVKVQLAPQTVRIEVFQGVRQAAAPANQMMEISKQYVVVIGYKDDPLMPNTNLIRADQFFHQERMYEVVDTVDTVPGRLLVTAELIP